MSVLQDLFHSFTWAEAPRTKLPDAAGAEGAIAAF